MTTECAGNEIDKLLPELVTGMEANWRELSVTQAEACPAETPDILTLWLDPEELVRTMTI